MFSSNLTHAQAAATCLCCLQPYTRVEATKLNYTERYHAYCFSSCAGRHWLAHCQSTSKRKRRHSLLGDLYAEFRSDTTSKPTFIAWMDLARGKVRVYQKRADSGIVAATSLGPFFPRVAEILDKAYQSNNIANPGPRSTAPHHAVDWYRVPMVSSLVENGADYSTISKIGEISHRAISLGQDDIAHNSNDSNQASSVTQMSAEVAPEVTLISRLRAMKG